MVNTLYIDQSINGAGALGSLIRPIVLVFAAILSLVFRKRRHSTKSPICDLKQRGRHVSRACTVKKDVFSTRELALRHSSVVQ